MWASSDDSDSIDFDESTEEVRKLITYKKVSIFVSDGPSIPAQCPQYVQDLRFNKVRLLVQTNSCQYNSSLLVRTGITVMDIPFKRWHVPEEEVLKTFIGHLHGLLHELGSLAVAIQGFEDGPFIIVYALMNLGMNRLDALSVVREAEGEANFEQLQYLRKFEKELEAENLIKKQKEKDVKKEKDDRRKEQQASQSGGANRNRMFAWMSSAYNKLTSLVLPPRNE